MAIKILKKAPSSYEAKCTCGCSFSYELSDVRRQYQPVTKDVVSCPTCGTSVTHRGAP